MLLCKDVCVSFGRVEVLRDLDLAIHESEIVAVLGPNGSGKSTALKTFSGLVRPKSGVISHHAEDITRTSTADRVGLGITLVPQGRRLFGGMTIEENLRLGAYLHRKEPARIAASLERWYEFFPVLAERRDRRAEELSGGQQQMVAVARGLMAEPSILLLDEPSLGISPMIADELAAMFPRLRNEHGITILLVEQNVSLALSVADRVVVLKGGRIVANAPPSEFRDRRRLSEVFFA